MVTKSNGLRVDSINLQVGEFRLKDVSFEVPEGTYFIMLGPTGCGKTLLAETLCGLNVPAAGSVYIAGRDITRTDPAERNIGYVPQDYALLPFKTVEENIAFGLKARKIKEGERRRRISEVADMLDISHLRTRYPVNLSGGERQRVALGRALAIKPDVLVLDEPLSALDEGTCRELMRRLKDIHRHLNTTIVHICHRLEEAITLGDVIMVMREGRVEQVSPARDIFKRPANLFVAQFLRLTNVSKGYVTEEPETNVFCLGDTAVTETHSSPGDTYCVIPLQGLSVGFTAPEIGKDKVVVESVISENNTAPNSPGLCLNGDVDLKIPGVFSEQEWQRGKRVFLTFSPSDIYLFKESSHNTRVVSDQ